MSLPAPLPYFPRPGLLAEVTRLLISGSNVTLFAPRRQGKTWFVRYELLPALHEAGWFAARVDLWRNRDNPSLGLVEGLEAIAYSNPRSQLSLSVPFSLRSVRGVFNAAGVEIEGHWEPAAAPPNPEASLENRLANALQIISRKGQHCVLALDEFQSLADKGAENFVAAFRTALQDLEGALSIVFTGSSRDGLTRLFSRSKAPLFRSAISVSLPSLGDDFVDSRADYLADVSDLEVDRDVLRSAFATLCRVPLFLNEVVRWMLVKGNPSVEEAMQAWMAAKRNDEYSELFAELSDLDLAIIMWLARSGQRSVYTEDARRMIGLMTKIDELPAHKIQTRIKRLTKSQVLEATGATGEYEIADQGLQILLGEPLDKAIQNALASMEESNDDASPQE